MAPPPLDRGVYVTVNVAHVSREVHAVEDGGVQLDTEVMSLFSRSRAYGKTFLVEVAVSGHITQLAGLSVNAKRDVRLRSGLSHYCVNPVRISEVVRR